MCVHIILFGYLLLMYLLIIYRFFLCIFLLFQCINPMLCVIVLLLTALPILFAYNHANKAF